MTYVKTHEHPDCDGSDGTCRVHHPPPQTPTTRMTNSTQARRNRPIVSTPQAYARYGYVDSVEVVPATRQGPGSARSAAPLQAA